MNVGQRLYIVMLGAPGAGKGTQARIAVRGVGRRRFLPAISSGEPENQTPLACWRSNMWTPGAGPDDVTINMVMDRLGRPDCAASSWMASRHGQADALDQALQSRGQRIGVAPLLEVADEAVIARLAGRRVCRECQAMYNIDSSPSQVEGKCDKCGGELYRRADDDPETVRNRLFVYYKQTAPLIGYYYAHRLLVPLSGDRPVEVVQADLRAAVDAAASAQVH